MAIVQIPVDGLQCHDTLPDRRVFLPDNVAPVGALDLDGAPLHSGETFPGKVTSDKSLKFQDLNLKIGKI